MKTQRSIPITMLAVTVIVYGLLAVIVLALRAAHSWPPLAGGVR